MFVFVFCFLVFFAQGDDGMGVCARKKTDVSAQLLLAVEGK